MKSLLMLFLFGFLIASGLLNTANAQSQNNQETSVTEVAFDYLDPRLKEAVASWSAWEIYKDDMVRIPDTWIIHSFDYNGKGDPDRKEKQVWLALGWKDCDAEVIIALGLFGRDNWVQVEITRLGGSEIHVLYQDREIVKFKKFKKGLTKGYFATTISNIKNRKNAPSHAFLLWRLPSKLLKKL